MQAAVMQATEMLAAVGTVVSVGECMIEMARGADGRFALAYGGDTFNTAVYLARAGVPVAYATKLGDDPYSQGILSLAAAEGVRTDLIATVPGRNAGLYVIETTADGERTFHYWRDRAPARELFDGEHALIVAAALNDAALIYLSGITLSLFDARGLTALETALSAAKTCGARVAIDGNYRPRGWGGDVPRARATFERFFRLADVALPTYDDEQMLWGDPSPDATLARLGGWGIPEIALKRGGEGALVSENGVVMAVPCPRPIAPLDTTAAGDSFNAGYLAARLSRRGTRDAAEAGHALAAIVIGHRGAIVPRAETDQVLVRS